MVRVQGSVLKEQGVTFAIIIVQKHVLEFKSDRDAALESCKKLFPGMPIVLMAQDSMANPSYYGPEKIVSMLKGVSPEQIPWKEYTFT